MCKINQIKSLKDDINYIQELLDEVNKEKSHIIDTETPRKALETALDCMNKELEKLTNA